MRKHKRFETRYIVLIILIIIVLFLALFTYTTKDKRNLTGIEKVIRDSILAVQKVIMKPINFVGDKIGEIKDKNNLYEKYEKLKEKEEQYDLLDTKNKELENEIKDLKKLLELNSTPSEYSYLNATVISRNIGYWYNTITIDKGSNHGVEIDMAVIVNEGLIGKITKTTNFTSDIKLLSTNDLNSKISIKIDTGEKSVFGLLVGYDTKEHYFKIEGIAENTEIPIDSVVSTSGMGGIFPSGILIGKVAKIDKDNFDLAKEIYVKSDVDFDDIKFVTVLKKKGSQWK